MSEIQRKLCDRPTLQVVYHRRSKDARMGRFGGGWQWQLGIQVGTVSRQRGTVILNLLVGWVRITWTAA